VDHHLRYEAPNAKTLKRHSDAHCAAAGSGQHFGLVDLLKSQFFALKWLPEQNENW
jgi:hypothetical protein